MNIWSVLVLSVGFTLFFFLGLRSLLRRNWWRTLVYWGGFGGFFGAPLAQQTVVPWLSRRSPSLGNNLSMALLVIFLIALLIKLIHGLGQIVEAAKTPEEWPGD